jgi:hypothetical protein
MVRQTVLIGFAAAILLPATCFAQQILPPFPEGSAPMADRTAAPQLGRLSGREIPPTENIIRKTPRVYSDAAKVAPFRGTDVFRGISRTDGSVEALQTISGPPVLANAAIGAIKQENERPTFLNGEPRKAECTVSAMFMLGTQRQVTVEKSLSPAESVALSDPNLEDHQGEKPIDPQLKSDIQHLLVTMKGQQSAETGVRSTFEALRPQLEASLPHTANRDKIIDAYEEKLVDLVRSPSFQEGIVAIYAKHFTDAEVKALDQFFETPSGQHFIQELPGVVNESAQLGQQAATDSIPRILNELCNEFPELQGEANFCPAESLRKESLRISRLADPPFAVAVGNGRAGS